jgi:predicted transglutaminase-like cysteine proteinase
MVSSWKKVMVGAVLLLCGQAVAGAQAADVRAGYAVITTQTSVPYGWVDFCNRYAGECDGPVLPAEDIVLTAKAYKEIDHINRSVNKSLHAETDMDHWGVIDRWDYPLDGKGDCEDYALQKRKLLMDAGYPRQALLMTVVKDHMGEGHAILTIKTTKGEFVLDNMVNSIQPWDHSGYRFVKRQSQEDPNIWKSIGPAVSAPLYTSNK